MERTIIYYGIWEINEDGKYVCSGCGSTSERMMNYCPRCYREMFRYIEEETKDGRMG